MKVLVLTPYLHDTVPGQRFRIEQWARVLAASGIQFHFVPFESPQLKAILHREGRYTRKAAELLRCMVQRAKEITQLQRKERWDLIFLYRELLPMGPPIAEFLLARTGIPIVYDFDDAIFLPDVSDANRRFAWLKMPQKTGAICRWSSHVVVGNDYLKRYALRFTPRVTMIPTTIDLDAYTPKREATLQDIPVIGWSGSLTTLKHLRTLEPTLRQLAQRLPFHLKVIGSAEYRLSGVQVEAKAWSAANEIEDLQSFDIGIMPLPNDAWSLGKCGLKALQYMAMGVPTVASPVGVNTEIIQDGRNGFIAENPSQWIEKIFRLVREESLRKQFARQGRRTVEETYSAEVQSPRLADLFEAVRETARQRNQDSFTQVPSRVSSPASASASAPHAVQPQDIICFSSIDWDFVWQGHQEIMSTLAKQGHRVLFIENTGVRNPQLRDFPRMKLRLGKWHRSLQGFWEAEKNLYVFSPLVLPFPYSKPARWFNSRWMHSTLKRWMRIMGFHQPICWTFLPTPLTLEIIRKISPKVLIYYCIDSFADSTPAAHRILGSEKTLLREADLVFVTSHKLLEMASRWSSRVHFFPFGVNFENFKKVVPSSGGELPAELKSLRRPVVGYIGGVHQWVDQELLAQTARACPDYSFLLVGPVQTEIDRLQAEPNIFLIGQKPHEELPHYVRHFDVGIIPYRLTEYTNNVYPTKLNEYHAMGKPVVSTPLPEVLAFNKQYRGLVRIGQDGAQFRSEIEQALQENPSQETALRMEAAQENSWNHRIQKMQGLIQEVVQAREAASLENWSARFGTSLRNYRRFLNWGMGLLLAGAIFLYSPLVWWIAKPLVLQDAPQRADAVVIFAGGVGESGNAGEGYQERILEGVGWFKEGLAPALLFVSGYAKTFNEPDIMKALAESLGVSPSAILTETRVHDTYDYVLRVKERAAEHGWKSILLVTSPYHTRRTALTFTKNAPDLKVWYLPLRNSSFYERERVVQVQQVGGILHEYLGILVYWLKGWI